MRSEGPLAALLDIRHNGHLAIEFTGTLTAAEFAADLRTFYAVTRALEIVSEAARRLPAEVYERHPALPWRAIRDVGNVYRHDYDNIAEDIVWRTVHQSVPALLAVIELEIKRLGHGV